MRAHPFATVVGVVDGAPEIAHLPVLILEHEGALLVQAHVARGNPIAQLAAQGAQLTFVFHGPHGYVSPSLYLSAPQVPTWNYAVVHASGQVRALPNDREKMQHLEALVSTFERGRAQPWSLESSRALSTQLLTGIIAFEVQVSHLETKLKLSQNRAPEDRAAVLRHYESSQNADERAMAALMRQL